jgi:polysaccharide biosynthesis protein PelF
MSLPQADICLLLEGTYPYVSGGVSVWVHDLLKAQSNLTFSIVALLPDRAERARKFDVPPNVVGIQEIYLQEKSRRGRGGRRFTRMVERMEPPLSRLLQQGSLDDLAQVIDALKTDPDTARTDLLNAEESWRMIVGMYERGLPDTSFLDYFWSWRSLAGGLFATLLADLPPARLYHAVSTGYAGVLLARAALETGRPALLTEHGIYTNERRVEIAMADWLTTRATASLDIDKSRRDLRDFWIDAFVGYSRACYEACAEIVTLYGGNQELQKRDGAPPDRLRVIPNGIDYDGYAAVVRSTEARRPTVVLIGRVVPIKDVKTFIRAIASLREAVPDLQAEIWGPDDEDAVYAEECRTMAAHLGLLEGTLNFMGKVNIREQIGRVDVIALTSISEAQPLVILEAGAAGVPSVATDVGSCREIIYGRPDEEPWLGKGGEITPLSNPMATARALAELLLDPRQRAAAAASMKARVERSYNKREIDRVYADLYAKHLAAPDAKPSAKRAAA